MAGLVTLIEIASALVGALEAVLSKAILRKSIRAGLNLRKIAVTRILAKAVMQRIRMNAVMAAQR